MVEKHLTVMNELGIHARVASRITRCCQSFACDIAVVRDGAVHNIKNVLSVISIGAKYGETVTVQFNGEDEEAASVAVEQLFANKFGEK